MLGGPSIGDLRSRLTRLIDVVETDRSKERTALKELLSYRLPADASEQEVKDEWTSIVEGRHALWANVPAEKREAIRGFLNSFHFEVIKRAHKGFNFRNGSIGNFFLTGARLFFGNLEAALFLFSAITGIPDSAKVVPVISTNHTATIAAQLTNGDTLNGQNEISHPPAQRVGGKRHPTPGCRWTRPNPIDAFSHLALGNEDDYPLSPELDKNANLIFSKHADQKLSSPIQRIYYINQYGQEIYPLPNPRVVDHLSCKKTLIYSIGSLYTSIVPCLILRSIGNAICHSSTLKQKILLLNGTNDRETDGYTAIDFINTITAALNQSRKVDAQRAFYQALDGAESDRASLPSITPSSSSSTNTNILPGTPPHSHTPPHYFPPFPDNQFQAEPPSSFITHLVFLDNSAVKVDVAAVEALNIRCVQIRGAVSKDRGYPIYNENVLADTIRRICSEEEK